MRGAQPGSCWLPGSATLRGRNLAPPFAPAPVPAAAAAGAGSNGSGLARSATKGIINTFVKNMIPVNHRPCGRQSTAAGTTRRVLFLQQPPDGGSVIAKFHSSKVRFPANRTHPHTDCSGLNMNIHPGDCLS